MARQTRSQLLKPERVLSGQSRMNWSYDPKKPLPKLGFHWEGRCQILMADGSISAIGKEFSEKSLRRHHTGRRRIFWRQIIEIRR